MALTSDAGNDAPCDNLPQVSTQNLAHTWRCRVRMSSASGSSRTSAMSAVSAFINVFGEDVPLCRKRHASATWILLNKRELLDRHRGHRFHHYCEHACRGQSGSTRPPQLSTTHHLARDGTQAQEANATCWPLPNAWRLAFIAAH